MDIGATETPTLRRSRVKATFISVLAFLALGALTVVTLVAVWTWVLATRLADSQRDVAAARGEIRQLGSSLAATREDPERGDH